MPHDVPMPLIRMAAIQRVQEDYPENTIGMAIWHAKFYMDWSETDIEHAQWIWEQAVKDWELILINRIWPNRAFTPKNKWT